MNLRKSMKKLPHLIVCILGGISLFLAYVLPVCGDVGLADRYLEPPVERETLPSSMPEEAKPGIFAGAVQTFKKIMRGNPGEIVQTFERIMMVGPGSLSGTQDLSNNMTESTSGEGMVSDYLIKRGKRYYTQRNRAKAIHELSKVLIINPNEKEAAYYLNKLGVHGGVYGRPQTTATRIARLSGEIHEYKKNIAVLEKENIEQAQATQSLQGEKISLRHDILIQEAENNTLREEAKSLLAQRKARIKSLEVFSKKKRKEIVRLNTDLFTWKSKLAKRVASLKEKDQQLEETRRRLSQEITKTQQKVRTLSIREKEIEGKNLEIAHLSKDLSSTKDRLAAQSAWVKAGENQLKATEEWFNQKINQIVEQQEVLPKQRDKGLKAYQRETERRRKTIALREKNFEKKIQSIRRRDQFIVKLKRKLVLARRRGKGSDYELLQMRLEDTQERLNLVEGLMKEKDEEVKSLEKQLLEMLTPFEGEE